jgi:hypothetical protein
MPDIKNSIQSDAAAQLEALAEGKTPGPLFSKTGLAY